MSKEEKSQRHSTLKQSGQCICPACLGETSLKEVFILDYVILRCVSCNYIISMQEQTQSSDGL